MSKFDRYPDNINKVNHDLNVFSFRQFKSNKANISPRAQLCSNKCLGIFWGILDQINSSTFSEFSIVLYSNNLYSIKYSILIKFTKYFKN